MPRSAMMYGYSIVIIWFWKWLTACETLLRWSIARFSWALGSGSASITRGRSSETAAARGRRTSATAFRNDIYLRACSGARQQFGAIGAPERVELQRYRRAKPHSVDAVVVDRVGGERVNQHVKAIAVQHQPLDNGLKLLGLEDDLCVGDRMRPDRLVAEAAELDPKLLSDDGA